MPIIERFIVLMYDRCSSAVDVNTARRSLFSENGREIENIPPTQDALKQHIFRAAYQAGYVWQKAIERKPYPSKS